MKTFESVFEAYELIGSKIYFNFEKNWIFPLNPSFLLIFSYTVLYARWDLSNGGRFASAIKSGAAPKIFKTFSEMPKFIMKHILEPWSNWNSKYHFLGLETQN